jgi:hypothetical protein
VVSVSREENLDLREKARVTRGLSKLHYEEISVIYYSDQLKDDKKARYSLIWKAIKDDIASESSD